MYGGRYLQQAILIYFIVQFGVFALGGFSPYFAALSDFARILLRMSHFDDVLYRAGGFIGLIFFAGMGLDACLRFPKAHIKRFAIIFLAWIMFVLVWLWAMDKDSFLSDPYIGHAILIALAVLQIFWMRIKNKISVRAFGLALCLLTLVDASTQVYFFTWEKTIHLKETGVITEAPSSNFLGAELPEQTYVQTDSLISLRPYMELAESRLNPERLPSPALYFAAHAERDISSERSLLAPGAKYSSLGLAAEAFSDPAYSDFLGKPGREGGSAKIVAQDFNHLDISVSSPESALLFVRDGYSPFWNAEVQGRKVKPVRALFNFKAIAVPAGDSLVKLEFHPPMVGESILIVEMVLLGLLVTIFRSSPVPFTGPRKLAENPSPRPRSRRRT
jgi:hypothetical protein